MPRMTGMTDIETEIAPSAVCRDAIPCTTIAKATTGRQSDRCSASASTSRRMVWRGESQIESQGLAAGGETTASTGLDCNTDSDPHIARCRCTTVLCRVLRSPRLADPGNLLFPTPSQRVEGSNGAQGQSAHR